MDIQSLEINLLKVSEIKEGDIVIVKIKDSEKSKISKEIIKNLYKQITNIVKKEIPIYFFPDYLSIEMIKEHINIVDKKLKESNIENKEI
jgi:acetamidase/formamidase